MFPFIVARIMLKLSQNFDPFIGYPFVTMHNGATQMNNSARPVHVH